MVKKLTKECKDQFAECKGYEDSSVKFISSCKTGSSALKTTLTNLFTASDMVSKVMNKSSTVATKGDSSTARQLSTITTITYTTVTVNTSDTAAFTNSSLFMNAMAMFTDVSQKLDVDAIATDSRIRWK